MKTLKIILLITLAIILILEILPFGVVMHFKSPDSEPERKTFSYFDMTPFAYSNIYPFVTALITVFLTVFAVLLVFFKKTGFSSALVFLSVVGLAFSVVPLFSGAENFSPVGLIISILMLVCGVISCFIRSRILSE